jgi:hypothetical protein
MILIIMCELYHITTVSALRQEQHPLGGRHLAENTLLDRQVEPGIVRVREQEAGAWTL